VFGADLSLASLALAQRFKTGHAIERAAFLQADLFRAPFRPASFDLVIANGVLHHTADPAGGLAALARLLKPGGNVIVGLYNAFGRIPTDLRRTVFRLTGNRFSALDPRLRRADLGRRRRDAWFADQYQNPHESKHTMGEVLRWFAQAGLTYVNGIPKPRFGESFSSNERLFEPHDPGGRLSRFAAQAALLLRGGPEGGFFLMIGRRN
jgi:SAM-dependent methyltransferase